MWKEDIYSFFLPFFLSCSTVEEFHGTVGKNTNSVCWNFCVPATVPRYIAITVEGTCYTPYIPLDACMEERY